MTSWRLCCGLAMAVFASGCQGNRFADVGASGSVAAEQASAQAFQSAPPTSPADSVLASKDWPNQQVANPPDYPRRPITQRDIVCWTLQGLSDEEVIGRIEASGTVFRLTAADEQVLRQNRVSEEVIRAMRDTARRM